MLDKGQRSGGKSPDRGALATALESWIMDTSNRDLPLFRVLET